MVVPIILDVAHRLQLIQMATWPSISTGHVRLADALVFLVSKMFPDAVDIAWYVRFVSWIVQLI